MVIFFCSLKPTLTNVTNKFLHVLFLRGHSCYSESLNGFMQISHSDSSFLCCLMYVTLEAVTLKCFNAWTIIHARKVISGNIQPPLSSFPWGELVIVRKPELEKCEKMYMQKLFKDVCTNRPFAQSGHMVQNKLCWDASYTWDFQNKGTHTSPT